MFVTLPHTFALAAYILFIFTSPQVSKSFFPYIEEILKYFLFILFPLFLGSDSSFFLSVCMSVCVCRSLRALVNIFLLFINSTATVHC